MAARLAEPNGNTPDRPAMSLGQGPEGTLVLRLSGDWRLKSGLPTSAAVETQLEPAAHPRRLAFDTSALGGWDSGLLAFLVGIEELCGARGVDFDPSNLPEGAHKLLKLATA